MAMTGHQLERPWVPTRIGAGQRAGPPDQSGAWAASEATWPVLLGGISLISVAFQGPFAPASQTEADSVGSRVQGGFSRME